MTALWAYFMINDGNQSRLHTVLCEKIKKCYCSIFLQSSNLTKHLILFEQKLVRAANMSSISKCGQVGVQKNGELHMHAKVFARVKQWSGCAEKPSYMTGLQFTRAPPFPHLPGSTVCSRLKAPHTFFLLHWSTLSNQQNSHFLLNILFKWHNILNIKLSTKSSLLAVHESSHNKNRPK